MRDIIDFNFKNPWGQLFILEKELIHQPKF